MGALVERARLRGECKVAFAPSGDEPPRGLELQCPAVPLQRVGGRSCGGRHGDGRPIRGHERGRRNGQYAPLVDDAQTAVHGAQLAEGLELIGVERRAGA